MSTFISYASGDQICYQELKSTRYEEDRVGGEYIVTMNRAVNKEFIYEVFSANEVSYVEKITDRIFLIRLEIDPGLTDIQESYMQNNLIEAIQPNYKYEAMPTER